MISLSIFLELEVTEAGKNCLDVGATTLGIAEQCREAAKVLGKSYSGKGTWSTNPRGCYFDISTNQAFWNTAFGNLSPLANSICRVRGKYMI